MSWETSVIGTALADPQTMVVAEDLIPADFTGSNKVIWGEMLALHHRQALDVRTLVETLRSYQQLDELSSDTGTVGEAYIQELLSYRGNNMEEYVDQVLGNTVKRNVKRSAALIAAEADGNEKTADELLDFAEEKILSLRRNRTLNDGCSIGDIIGLFIPRVEAVRAGTYHPAWVPAVGAVKDVLLFAEKSDFLIFAGRPGDGKSSYARKEIFEHVRRGGVGTIFNLENDPSEYARNFIALDTGIDSQLIKDATKLSPEQLNLVKQSARRLQTMPIQIYTTPGASVAEIKRMARTDVAVNKTNLICVDYLQLMNNGLENKVQDVGKSSSGLRSLSLELQVPIIANSQLNRAIETRSAADAEPKLSDLRDSGTVEQDGTTIMFIRNAWTNPTNEQQMIFPENRDENGHLRPRVKAVPVRFIIAKNRNGETGNSDLVKWNKSTGQYQTLNRGITV